MVRPPAPGVESICTRGGSLRYDETLNDEQGTAREMIMEMDHPLHPEAQLPQAELPQAQFPDQKEGQ